MAHYFAVLLVEGQVAVGQLAVLARGGLDALEGARAVANYEVLPGALAAGLQLAGFVAPHLVAVLVGHDLAIARYVRRDPPGPAPRAARAAQVPLRALLVVSVVGGIALRYSAA